MSIFDYIGLIICGLFLFVIGLAALGDLIDEFRSGVGSKAILVPLYLLVLYCVYEGFFWIYHFPGNA